jgi:uncharacterized protein (DUF2147 family)
MTRFFLSVAAVLVFAAPSTARARGGLEGHWRRGHMEIVIRPCGETLCGTVVKASEKQQARAERGSGTDLIGARVIENIRPTGPGVYRADVYVADKDVTAKGTIREIDPNHLDVRGCVFGLLCKTTSWTRIQ